MRNYTKKEAIQVVTTCAKIYDDELNNKQLMFMFKNKLGQICFVEVSFSASNFMHLTGLKSSKISKKDFYKKCLDGKLRESDFEFADDGTTNLKLAVLLSVINAHLGATMIGDFNSPRLKLYTDKLVGGTKACVGLKKSNAVSYVPNTVLNEDIRKEASDICEVLAVFRKNINESLYNEVTHKGRSLDPQALSLPQNYQYLAQLL